MAAMQQRPQGYTARRQPCQKWCQNETVMELLNDKFNNFSFIFCTTNGNTSLHSFINPLQTKLNLLYIRNQSVPRCKHFPTRL